MAIKYREVSKRKPTWGSGRSPFSLIICETLLRDCSPKNADTRWGLFARKKPSLVDLRRLLKHYVSKVCKELFLMNTKRGVRLSRVYWYLISFLKTRIIMFAYKRYFMIPEEGTWCKFSLTREFECKNATCEKLYCSRCRLNNIKWVFILLNSCLVNRRLNISQPQHVISARIIKPGCN